MKWKGRRQSENVIDSRGKKVVQTAGAGILLNFVARRFGLKGILILLAVFGVLWVTGLVDPSLAGSDRRGCFGGQQLHRPRGPAAVDRRHRQSRGHTERALESTRGRRSG